MTYVNKMKLVFPVHASFKNCCIYCHSMWGECFGLFDCKYGLDTAMTLTMGPWAIMMLGNWVKYSKRPGAVDQGRGLAKPVMALRMASDVSTKYQVRILPCSHLQALTKSASIWEYLKKLMESWDCKGICVKRKFVRKILLTFCLVNYSSLVM